MSTRFTGMRDNPRLSKILCSFLLTVFFLSADAQNTSLSGRVVDDKTREPLAGAVVHIKGTTHQVVTGEKGDFKFVTGQKVPLAYIVTFVGYVTQEVAVTDENSVTISLLPGSATLSDVYVSSGYSTQSKKDYTGSAAQVTSAQLEDKPAQSFDQLLGGQAAGVNIVQPSNTLNNTPVFRIRGINSITSGIYPLIVVDGIAVFTGSTGGASANGSGGVGNNPLADINPNDIETIDVLKDAAATAIYGSRAANGVVVITTKKGKKGHPKVTYSFAGSLSTAYNTPKELGAEDYVKIKNEARENAGLSDAFALQTNPNGGVVNTDWHAVAYHTGASQDHNLSIAGANETTNYYLSVGYSDQNSFIRTNQFGRKIARLNLDHKLIDEVTIGANVSFSNSINRGPNTGAIAPDNISAPNGNSVNYQYIGDEPLARLTYILPPNLAVKNTDGSYNINKPYGVIGWGADNPSLGPFNAYNLQTLLDLDKNTSENNTLIANVYAEWTILKGLKLKTNYGLDQLTVENTNFLNPFSGDGFATNGAATNSNTKYYSSDWTNTLIYNTNLGNRQHLKVLAGYEQIARNSTGWGATEIGITDPFYSNYEGGWASIIPAAGANFQSNSGLVSYFSNLNYDFDRKYLLSVNFRRDGLSALSAGNKYGNFSGGSIGWNVSEEGFFKSSTVSKVINALKIRASYGQVGNSNIGDFPSLSTYGSATYTGLPSLTFAQAGNSALKWETSNKTDIGLNASLLHNRLTVEFDYYNNTVNNLILNSPQALSEGIPGNSISTNVGSLYNRGIELALGATLIDQHNFRWNANFNISTLKNVVTSLGDGGDIYPTALSSFGIQNITRVGYSIGSIFAVPTTGVDPQNGERIYLNHLGQLEEYNAVTKGFTYVKSSNGTTAPAIDNYADGRIQGPSLPTYFGGLNNTFSYKGLDLNIGITFSGGNKIYNGTRATLADQRYFNNGTFILHRWTTPGQVTDIPKLVFGDKFTTGFTSANSALVEDGSYAKLKNITLGYHVPLLAPGLKSRISSIYVYVQATNLFTVTNYRGSDPEVSINGNSINSGKDQNVPPNARLFAAGLNVGF
jgi:TonB-dependent starch-binding outer membrane protein SusC